MSGESVILTKPLKVNPRGVLEAEHRERDPHARRLDGDPADRGKGRRRRRHLLRVENSAAVDAMRCDPRLKAHFPKIAELAS